jgi:hypothetical protein
MATPQVTPAEATGRPKPLRLIWATTLSIALLAAGVTARRRLGEYPVTSWSVVRGREHLPPYYASRA